MDIKYKKNHNNGSYKYSEIILDITDTSKDRIKNIYELEKKILNVLSKEKGE